MQRVASRVIGAIIGVFALRLIYEGVTQRWADNLLST
jgi:amino acid exporter